MTTGRRLGLGVSTAAALAASLVVASASGGPATTEPLLPVSIKVSLTNARATLDVRSVERGAIVDFFVRNRSRAIRTFSIAGLRVSVKPQAVARLTVAFDVRGRYPFTAAAPGTGKPHRGVLRVT